MVDTDDLSGEFVFEIESIIWQYANSFKELRNMKDYQIKLYSDEKVKCVAVAQRSVLYHLQARVSNCLKNMIKNDVIKEHQSNEPAPWVAHTVIFSKDDGSLRVTLDARNFK